MFSLTDYKISSKKTFLGIIISINIILFTLTIARAFLDLRSTTLPVILSFTVLTLFISILALRYPQSSILRIALVAVLYLIVEVHFILNPTIFHTINYWFPLVPLFALIIHGLKSFRFWLVVVIISHFINAYYLGQMIGESYSLTIFRIPFLVGSIVFLFGILATSFLLYKLLGDAYQQMKKQNTLLIELQTQIENKNEILYRYQKSLLNLSRNEYSVIENQRQTFSKICSTAASTLSTNRVSIWLLEEKDSRIVRKYQYEDGAEVKELVVLEKKDFPIYFSALEKQPFILANDAKAYESTKEFKDVYLTPLNIYSMLDCPIIVDGKTIGVICCEHKHEIRTWHTEDALFVQSLADFISINFKNTKIQRLLSEVTDQHTELIEKNKKIDTINYELSALNEELMALNDGLEDTVQSRTQELENQNKQLTEYAFINSHVLRAPLARILGVSQLLTYENSSIEDQKLLEALIASTQELDSIVKNISELLYYGKPLTREELHSIITKAKEDQSNSNHQTL